MEMSNKIFAVDDVSTHDLEEHLNELATDNWVLHSIHQAGSGPSIPYFTVVAYRSYDWEKHFRERREKFEAELAAEEKAISAGKDAKEAWEAAEEWTVTMGTTNKDWGAILNAKKKGHANE